MILKNSHFKRFQKIYFYLILQKFNKNNFKQNLRIIKFINKFV